MEFLSDYGLFLAKAVTVVIVFLIILGAVAAQSTKGKGLGLDSGQVEIKKINDIFDTYEDTLKQALLDEKSYKAFHSKKKKDKKQYKQQASDKKRVFYVRFEGDVKASAVEKLRHEITAILTVAKPDDEVVVNIESPGGMVHTYGLAASQLDRLKTGGIPLTVCIDKVAASGGYLMACVADKIYAAPFAIVGSIGVLAQIPNFNRALKKLDVDYEVMTAGEYKAPITMFGEITEKGKSKLKSELEETHVLFKDYITNHRDGVAIEEVATGEVWYGQKAIDHNLIDEVLTSDDYLLSKRNDFDLYEVAYAEKKTIQEKLGLSVQAGISHAIDTIFHRDRQASVTRDIS